MLLLQGSGLEAFASDRSEKVIIQVLSCHPVAVPRDLRVFVSHGQGNYPEEATISLSAERSNLYAVGFALTPGNYRIDMVTTGCSDAFDLTIIPGHERHLASYMYKGTLDYHDHGTVSGSLPFGGLNIFARCGTDNQATSSDISAVIDGNAYYFNNLPACRYRLLVSFAFASIAIKLGKDVDITRASPHAVVDISLADVNAAGKSGLPFGTRLSIQRNSAANAVCSAGFGAGACNQAAHKMPHWTPGFGDNIQIIKTK